MVLYGIVWNCAIASLTSNSNDRWRTKRRGISSLSKSKRFAVLCTIITYKHWQRGNNIVIEWIYIEWNLTTWCCFPYKYQSSLLWCLTLVVACDNCGRKFNPDRLEVHLRSCKGMYEAVKKAAIDILFLFYEIPCIVVTLLRNCGLNRYNQIYLAIYNGPRC